MYGYSMFLFNNGIIATPATNPLWDNLYAAYKAESNANDSLGVYNGTAQGGLTYGTGKDGNAFVFNGTNAYVKMASDNFKFSGDFSINVWVNFSGTAINVQAVFSNLTYDGTYNYGYYLYYYNNTITFQISNNSGSVQLSNTTNLFSSWNMITISRTASTGTDMYCNGVLVNSNSSVQNPNYHANMIPAIGAADYGPTFSNLVQYYCQNNTKIDELYLYENRALTSTDVTELYNAGAGTFY